MWCMNIRFTLIYFSLPFYTIFLEMLQCSAIFSPFAPRISSAGEFPKEPRAKKKTTTSTNRSPQSGCCYSKPRSENRYILSWRSSRTDYVQCLQIMHLFAFLTLLLGYLSINPFVLATDNGKTTDVTWDKYSLSVKGERVYVFSGEFHYQRLPVPELWLDVFQKLRANGFNAVSSKFYT